MTNIIKAVLVSVLFAGAVNANPLYEPDEAGVCAASIMYAKNNSQLSEENFNIGKAYFKIFIDGYGITREEGNARIKRALKEFDEVEMMLFIAVACITHYKENK